MGDYYGIPTGFIENEDLRLEYLLEVDPHIVRLIPAGTQLNLLAETPDFGWDTPLGRYSVLGGHRLWHAPESSGRNSVLNKSPLQVENFEDGVRIYQPGDEHTRLGKVMEIRLAPDVSGVVLTHTLINEGMWDYELAPWAVTQLPLGGKARVAWETEWPNVPRDIPDRKMVLWPFTRLPDRRVEFGSECVHFNAVGDPQEFKLGFFGTEVWMEYRWKGYLFKKSAFLQTGSYPDGGCSMELFCNHLFMELETLGPTVKLAPGEQINHIETWQVTAKG